MGEVKTMFSIIHGKDEKNLQRVLRKGSGASYLIDKMQQTKFIFRAKNIS